MTNSFYAIYNSDKELCVEEIKMRESGNMYVQKYLLEKDKVISKLFMEHLTQKQLELFKGLIEEELNKRANKSGEIL